MNLSDFFGNGWDDPRTGQIMGLAQGLLSGRGSAGLAAGIQGMQQARQDDLRSQLAKLQIKGYDLQNQTSQMSLDEQRRKMADADRAREVLRSLIPGAVGAPSAAGGGAAHQAVPSTPADQNYTPTPLGSSTPADANYRPMLQPQAGAAGRAMPMEAWERYKMAGDALSAQGLMDAAQQQYTLAEKWRPKFSTTPQVVRNPQTGQLENILISEHGGTKALPYGVRPDMQLVDLGDRTEAVDKNAVTGGQSFQRGQSPESRASIAATLRGQDLTDARAREFNAVQVEANKLKRDEKKEAEAIAKGGQIASFDTMLGTLDRLAAHPGLSNSVGLMSALPTMPGSNSATFQAELNTFQSQAFLPMVAQLKGMGALSDAEGKKLTAAVGALDPKMGEQAFRESIGRIKSEMEAARARVVGAPRQGGASGSFGEPVAPARPPMRGQVVQGYKFKGGDPSKQENWEKQ